MKVIHVRCDFSVGIYLIGNKYDLKESSSVVVPHESVRELADDRNWKFKYCSAKEGFNLDAIFKELCLDIKNRSSVLKPKSKY